MESYEIKCTSCSLLLGESVTAVENIVCVFCLSERQQIRWIFSGIPQTVSREQYWKEFEAYHPIKPAYTWGKRRENSLELEAFINQLHWKCDMKETENE